MISDAVILVIAIFGLLLLIWPSTGILASGPIISLMDMATSLAIWVRLGRFRHQATLDLRVDYLRPR